MSTELKNRDGMAVSGAFNSETGKSLNIKIDENGNMVNSRRNGFQRMFIDEESETYTKFLAIVNFPGGKSYPLHAECLKFNDKILKIYFDEFQSYNTGWGVEKTSVRYFCDVDAYLNTGRIFVIA